jgi:hypothetical protein
MTERVIRPGQFYICPEHVESGGAVDCSCGLVPYVPEQRLRDAEAEIERLRQGLLACATEAGEDVSDGIPTWPDVVEWAVRAVREGRVLYESAVDTAEATHEALRAERDALREKCRKAHRLLENVSPPHETRQNLQWARDARALLAEALSAVRDETEGEVMARFRNPALVLVALQQAVEAYPDQRVMQVIVNALGEDPFYVEDTDAAAALYSYATRVEADRA